ncbi:MAG TPA: hypothetical protein VD978_13710, partial [Azospirillum sp.]|nr:hypothetical protein [Azospirillum sp.]
NLFNRDLPEDKPLIVEVLPLSSITNAPPPKPEPPKVVEAPKPPEPKPEPPKPEPPKPEPPKPQPPKPEPPKQKPPEKVDPLANLLKDVAKLKPTDQKSDAKPQQTAAPSAPTGAAKATQGPDKPFKPSGRAIDAIRGQVGKNWNFDPGRKDSGNMIVQLRIDVAMDGTVMKADFEPETRARMGSDTHFRSAAEAALRAVLRTQKLDLLASEFTPDTYDKWRTIVFTFDPRDMF